MLAPMLVLIVAIGVYPKPFLDRIEPSAEKVIRQLNATVDPAADVAGGPAATDLSPADEPGGDR